MHGTILLGGGQQHCGCWRCALPTPHSSLLSGTFSCADNLFFWCLLPSLRLHVIFAISTHRPGKVCRRRDLIFFCAEMTCLCHRERKSGWKWQNPVELVLKESCSLEILMIQRSNAGCSLRWVCPGARMQSLWAEGCREHKLHPLVKMHCTENVLGFFLCSNFISCRLHASGRGSWAKMATQAAHPAWKRVPSTRLPGNIFLANLEVEKSFSQNVILCHTQILCESCAE